MAPPPDTTPMRPPFFLTTPIFYVNDVPHIGHAYTVIAADTLARYKRLAGYDVFFLTGTDEHGQKIEKAAEARGEAPNALAARLAERFKALWRELNISHDDFIRTTEARHHRAVDAMYRRLKEQGDVYLGEYEGLYCIPCESFWTELQLVDGNCPDCGRPVEKVTEPSYFFRMSHFGARLLEHIDRHPEFVSPPSRRNEVVQFVKGGLRDLSISRTGVRWGIPLPDHPGHVVYVWLDALVNYLTATGFPEPGFEGRWPAQVHIIGKDILRFHAVYWPSFLLSAGLSLPERIVSHGWWTIAGEKMSKSKGNVIDPARVAAHCGGADALRYFLLREVPFGRDGDFSVQALVGRYNTDLANDLGNLVSRAVAMVHRYRDGVVPAPPGGDDPGAAALRDPAGALYEAFEAAFDDLDRAGRGLQFDQALAAVWAVVSAANLYIHESAPWELAKARDDAALDRVLYNALEAIRIVSLYLYPFMPASAERVWEQLGVRVTPGETDLAAASHWGGLAPGTALAKPAPLFPRLDPAAVPADLADLAIQPPATETPVEKTPAEKTPGAPPEAPAEYVSIHDFKRVQLRVGTVTAAEPIKKADKLLKLQVDIGEGEARQIVAGLARKFAPEDLVGRQVVVVANLRPAKLMGVESQGMILAAGAEEVEALLAPAGPVAPGTTVR
jgi:methionyl-tRNA synthetase